jgi:hypothetical protein
MLSSERRFPLTVIDCSSKNKGWTKRKNGVGHARKTLFDYIMKHAVAKDVLISLDADTTFESDYFSNIRNMFYRFPKHSGLISPYYHQLTGEKNIDRAILRYEIYLRCYMLNLSAIGSPYNFTALGSAIAVSVAALNAIGGITPFSSGEDFYLAQKLRKYAPLISSSQSLVFPSARLSDRVPFGTGPALYKGLTNNWNAYPVYTPKDFEPLRQTFMLFPTLFKYDCATPIDDFLRIKFGTQHVWQPLRNNFKTEQHFINACHQKIDGLRTLQFLHSLNRKNNDNEDIEENLCYHCAIQQKIDIQQCSINELNVIRNCLFQKEMEIRRSRNNS